MTIAPEGPSFPVEDGEDILGAGRRQGVWLPFECGWGSCSTCKVVLIAGGTGISAILALAEDLALSGDHRPVRVFYGAATRSELVCSEELESYVGSLADADVSEVLERPPQGWTGEAGYVTDALTRHLGAGDAANAGCYLAGPPPMVDATLAVLARLGVSIDRIHYDRFG
ncbi:MAG: 2Fe-2S iron-sulfur cluster-binding protein [Acidimicrobiales bacterium]